MFPAGFDPAAGCQACRRKWRNKPPRHPWRRHGQLTRARVLPTRSELCNGGGRAAGNESVASIFHTLAARQEPHYPGFQPPGRPCYPQVLSIVSCHIIRPRPRLFIAAPTEFHDSKTACKGSHWRTCNPQIAGCSPQPDAPPTIGGPTIATLWHRVN